MSAIISVCDSCEDNLATFKLLPYGSGYMVEMSCPACGVSYDTNPDAADIEEMKE